MPAGETLWNRWRVRLGYPIAVFFFLLAEPSYISLAIGATIALVGLGVRAAAAGHLRKHESLAVTGPYRYTRNPLYFGSALLAFGLVVAGRSWLGAALVATYFLASYPAVMKHEEKRLRALYGAEFEEYAARVALFWPSRMPHVPGGEKFSWRLYRRNREYQAALGFLVALLLLWLKMGFALFR